MKAIVVGAGGVARELLRRLGESWEVTVVDTSPERLAGTSALLPHRALTGDGSSRVTLNRAGAEHADAVVAATNDDDVNLEICRLARSLDVQRVAAVAVNPERIPDYRQFGVTAVSPDSLAARRIELSLETRRVASMAFADGRAEAIEFRVAPDSPVRGKRLAELHASSWIVGAVLRGEELIIPHGETVLETGDRVTVVGAGSEFSGIVRTFTSGEGRFPLDYGKRVAVAVADRSDLTGPLAEAVHLVRNSRASSLLVVHRDPGSVRDEIRAERLRSLIDGVHQAASGVELRFRAVPASKPGRALGSLPREESIGVLVMGAPSGRTLRARWIAHRAADLARRTATPVLLSRGSFPYETILLPSRRTPAGLAATRAAIDLARFATASVEGLAVVDPPFLVGPEASEEARRAVAALREEAAVQGIDARGTILRGNPVRGFLERGEHASLIVLGATPGSRSPLLRPRLDSLVAARTTRSVLLVPTAGSD